MHKLRDFRQSKYFTDILKLVSTEEIPKYYAWLDALPESLKPSRCKNMIQIIRTNGSLNALTLYDKYWSTNSKIQRIEIIRGSSAAAEYRKKLKARPAPKNFSILQTEYWVHRVGLTQAEANKRVTEVQSKNSRKRSMESYRNTKSKLKICAQYWLNLGYTLEEAEHLRKPYLYLNDLPSMIDRYGVTEGARRYNLRVENFRRSITANLASRRTAGYVSKESKKFFVKMYKRCRKLGIPRTNIYFGCSGSKEFFIRHAETFNRGRFFDFAIPKLNIVVEYNGVFWHPREEHEWRNPWISYDDAMIIEEEKSNLCKMRGYDLHILWSDSDLDKELNRIMAIVEAKLYVSGL